MSVWTRTEKITCVRCRRTRVVEQRIENANIATFVLCGKPTTCPPADYQDCALIQAINEIGK